MGSILHIPAHHESLAKITGEGLRYIPASFEHFLDLRQKADYKVEYHDGHIITKSYEPERHSDIISEFSFFLKTIFPRSEGKFKVHTPNRLVYVPNCGLYTAFSPDGSVVIQPSKHFEYSKGMNTEMTPLLLFEVLSPSTKNHDLKTKLPCYKKIETLRYIVYIDNANLGFNYLST